jgi:guanylate kinase
MSKVFLITAPSGAGKTTLCQAIINYGEWTECISHTTRKRREGEQHGKTYYFVNEDTFKMMDEKGELAEKVTYDGNSYGISKAEIDMRLKSGKDVFIIVDFDGFMQVKQQYPDAVGIFLHMKKEDCLANMLLRGDSMDRALERIKLYDKEMLNSISYEYVIKNVRGKQHETENIIRAIIRQYKKHDILFVNTAPFTVGQGITSKDTVFDTWK